MKKTDYYLSLLEKILPHIVIDMAGCFLVFLILNRYNPMMAFLSNKYSRVLLVIFIVSALLQSILVLRRLRRR